MVDGIVDSYILRIGDPSEFQAATTSINAEPGSYTFTGKDVGLDVEFPPKVLIAEAASPYVWTGAAATLSRSASQGDNEPAGFTQFRFNDATELVPSDWSTADTGPAKHSLSTEDPQSSPTVYRRTYPVGLVGGAGTQFIDSDYNGVWGEGVFPSSATEIYLSFWYRVSANFQYHSVVSKCVYWGTISSPYNFYAGPAGTSGEWQVRLQNDVPGGRTQDRNWRYVDADNGVSPSAGQVQISKGTWHFIEMHCRSNTVGNEDGQIHCWVNGIKTHEFDSTLKASAPNPPGTQAYEFFPERHMRSIRFDSIWGGLADQVQNEQTMDLDDIYLSYGTG